jgi:hypothetical protein
MDNKIIESIYKIYSDYNKFFHDISDFSVGNIYHKGHVFKYEDSLYIVLAENIFATIPEQDIKCYCKIPRTYEELRELTQNFRIDISEKFRHNSFTETILEPVEVFKDDIFKEDQKVKLYYNIDNNKSNEWNAEIIGTITLYYKTQMNITCDNYQMFLVKAEDIKNGKYKIEIL